MKIALFVCSISRANPGMGGHYYSLIETAKRFSQEHEVVILNIGIKRARALEDCDQKKIYVIEKGPKIRKIYKRVKTIISSEQPDIIHCFDHISLLWARFVGHKLKIPFSLTKCGNVNPKYYPYAEHLVLFSEENRKYFLNHSKFKDANLHLIPNRIQNFENDTERINIIKKQMSEHDDCFKFLRIARIGPSYTKSALQLINLVKRLNADGLLTSIIFIGTIEDEKYFNKLKSSAINTYFFTSNDMTNNAKQVIALADAILGTGRSFMEAAAKGKVLLSPIKEGEIPLLINRENFNKAFEYNFSERISIDDYDEKMNYRNIKNIVLERNKREEHSKFAKYIFKEYFDTDKLNEKYKKVFDKMHRPNRKNYLDVVIHTLFVIRRYYR